VISLIGRLDEAMRGWLCFVTADEGSLLRVARKIDWLEADCNLAINLTRRLMLLLLRHISTMHRQGTINPAGRFIFPADIDPTSEGR
jgi:hypothetical protein